MEAKEEIKKLIAALQSSKVSYLEHFISNFNENPSVYLESLKESVVDLIPVLIGVAGVYPELVSEAFFIISYLDGVENTLIRTQYFNAVKEFLVNYNEKSIIINIIDALALVSTDYSARASISQLGIIEEVCALLQEFFEDLDIVDSVLRFFANSLNHLISCKVAFVQENGVEIILQLLGFDSHAEGQTLDLLTLVLRNAVNMDHEKELLFDTNPNAVSHIFNNIIKHKTKKVPQINLLWSLSNLLRGNSHSIDLALNSIKKKELPEAILYSMGEFPDSVELNEAALVVLEKLSRRTLLRLAIINCDVIEEIIRLISRDEENKLKYFGLKLLNSLCVQTGARKELVTDNRLNTIVEIFKTTNQIPIKEQILEIFFKLSNGAQESKQQLKSLGVVSLLMEAITEFSGQESLRVFATNTMTNLFSKSEKELESEEPDLYDSSDDTSSEISSDDDELLSNIQNSFNFQYYLNSSESSEDGTVPNTQSEVDQLRRELIAEKSLRIELQEELRLLKASQSNPLDALTMSMSDDPLTMSVSSSDPFYQNMYIPPITADPLTVAVSPAKDEANQVNEVNNNEDLLLKIDELEKEIETLNQQVTLSQENEATLEKISKLEDLLSHQEEKLEKYEKSTTTYEESIKELNERNEASESEKIALVEENEAHLEKISKLEDLLSHQEEKLEKYENLSTSSQENEATEEKISKLEDLLSHQEEKLEKYEKLTTTYQDSIENYKTKAEEAQSQINTLKIEMERYSQLEKDHQSKVDVLQLTIAEKDTELQIFEFMKEEHDEQEIYLKKFLFNYLALALKIQYQDSGRVNFRSADLCSTLIEKEVPVEEWHAEILKVILE